MDNELSSHSAQLSAKHTKGGAELAMPLTKGVQN